MKNKGLFLLIALGGLTAVALLLLLRQPGDQPSAIAPLPTLAANGRTLYTLTPDSEASFTLGETLRGMPTSVVGVTNQVSGQLALNLDDLATAELSSIQIAASDLTTDSNLRNSAIRTYILYTDRFPTITFTPTDITGLPQQGAVGETLTFSIAGDLAIIGIFHPVTFAVTAVAESPTRITGTATATIDRTQWELAIPRVQGVANVDESVLLEVNFVAEAEG